MLSREGISFVGEPAIGGVFASPACSSYIHIDANSKKRVISIDGLEDDPEATIVPINVTETNSQEEQGEADTQSTIETKNVIPDTTTSKMSETNLVTNLAEKNTEDAEIGTQRQLDHVLGEGETDSVSERQDFPEQEEEPRYSPDWIFFILIVTSFSMVVLLTLVFKLY